MLITCEKGFLNPKRLKIIVGIIAILAFGLACDFLIPINAGTGYDDEQLAKYVKNRDFLADAIERYETENEMLPSLLLGGDKEGYMAVYGEVPDDLIKSGIIDSYPEIYSEMSVEQKRQILQFKMKLPAINNLMGKNGDCQTNALIPYVVYPEVTGESDSENFPFYGHFIYHKFDDRDAYQIFIILPEKYKSDMFVKYNAIVNRNEYPYGWDAFPDCEPLDLPIIGVIGIRKYGEWRRYEFFTGGGK